MTFKQKPVALAVHQALTFYSAWHAIQAQRAADIALIKEQQQALMSAALKTPVGGVRWKELNGKN